MTDMRERHAVIWMVIYIVSACLIALAFCSCKTKYVTVENVHDVYHNVVDTIRDSTIQEVYVYQYVKGDTVFKDKEVKVYKERWRIRDSIVIELDSIPYPVEVIKEVEKPVTPWYNYIIIGGLALALLYLIFKRVIG